MRGVGTLCTSGWYWMPETSMQAGHNEPWFDWTTNPPAMVFQPTMYDWIILDVAFYSHTERYLPPIYRFPIEGIIPLFTLTPRDKDQCDNHVLRYYLRHYLAPYSNTRNQWIRTVLDADITPPVPILIHPSRLVQLAQLELKCPTVYCLFDGFTTNHIGTRMLAPTNSPSSIRRYDRKPDMRVGLPYSVSLRDHNGYMLSCNGQIAFASFREETIEREMWHRLSGDTVGEPPIRDRDTLLEILAHRMTEMSMQKCEDWRELTTYPLESIWWHPVLNLCDREWDLLVNSVPRPTMITVTPAYNNK